MAMKTLFGSVRTSLVGTLVAAIGCLALAGCNSCSPCDPCKAGPPVYRKPCCAQTGGGGGMMVAPTPGPGPMAPAPGAGGQMACGAGKCG